MSNQKLCLGEGVSYHMQCRYARQEQTAVLQIAGRRRCTELVEVSGFDAFRDDATQLVGAHLSPLCNDLRKSLRFSIF